MIWFSSFHSGLLSKKQILLLLSTWYTTGFLNFLAYRPCNTGVLYSSAYFHINHLALSDLEKIFSYWFVFLLMENHSVPYTWQSLHKKIMSPHSTVRLGGGGELHRKSSVVCFGDAKQQHLAQVTEKHTL